MLKNLLVHIPSERMIRPIIDGAISLAVRRAAHLDAVSVGYQTTNVGLVMEGGGAAVAAAIESLGVASQPVEATSFLVTDENFGEAAPLMEASAPRGQEVLLPLLAKGVVPVVTGFIGATTAGTPTTLGRPA